MEKYIGSLYKHPESYIQRFRSEKLKEGLRHRLLLLLGSKGLFYEFLILKEKVEPNMESKTIKYSKEYVEEVFERVF